MSTQPTSPAMWRAVVLLGLAILWGLICLRTMVFQEAVAFAIPSHHASIQITTGRGNIAIMAWSGSMRLYPGVLWETLLISGSPTLSEQYTGHHGWIWAIIPLSGKRGTSVTFTIPTVLVFLFLAVPGVWQLRRSREFRREQLLFERRCEFCEYDLRASTGHCPECGAVIPDPVLPPSL